MYPMRLIPVYKQYLWGGQHLWECFGKGDAAQTTLAESWELSTQEKGCSRIAEGIFSGQSLQQVLQAHPLWLGSRCFTPGLCPVLVKLIDAAQPLSVQVHPSDETANLSAGEQGKAEMWYILAAEPGAFLYAGLQRTLSREAFLAHAQTGEILEDLQRFAVHPGEVYAIPPGTIHALGAGLMVAEVQQSSDTTFRIYDYQRRDTQGKLRPLHLERAAQVAHLQANPAIVGVRASRYPGQTALYADRHFRVFLLNLQHRLHLEASTISFQGILWLQGEGTLFWHNQPFDFCAGQSWFLPAGMGVYRLQGKGTGLLVEL